MVNRGKYRLYFTAVITIGSQTSDAPIQIKKEKITIYKKQRIKRTKKNKKVVFIFVFQSQQIPHAHAN